MGSKLYAFQECHTAGEIVQSLQGESLPPCSWLVSSVPAGAEVTDPLVAPRVGDTA
jgi:hypothetical protein